MLTGDIPNVIEPGHEKMCLKSSAQSDQRLYCSLLR